jgi:hypothetical protein
MDVYSQFWEREQTTVLLERKVDINEHDHAGSDDGTYSELHESGPVGGEDNTHPIE